MTLFANEQESNLRSCEQMVEDVIEELGHDLADARAPGDSPSWWIRKGSAYLFVKLLGRDGKNFLKVFAPILKLDDRVNRPELYESLLKLNADATCGAAFALEGDQIILIAERSTLDLDRSEVQTLVGHVAEYADKYDDILIGEYGGLPAGPSQ